MTQTGLDVVRRAPSSTPLNVSASDHPRSSVLPAATERIRSSKSSHDVPGVPSCGCVRYLMSMVAMTAVPGSCTMLLQMYIR